MMEMNNWLDDPELQDMDSGEIQDNLPSEVLHKWALKAADSFDSFDIILTGIDSKLAELQEQKKAIQERKERRKAYLIRYLLQLPDKELIVGVDKFKAIESSATKCEVRDKSLVPQNYMKYTLTVSYSDLQKIPDCVEPFGTIKIEPDISKIKADSQKGVEIAGTEIVPISASLRKNNKGV